MGRRRATTTINRQLAHERFDYANLIAVLDLATDEDWSAGITWYARAHEEAVSLSETYGCTILQACGIIAALSPQNGWDNNLAAAALFLQDPTRDIHFHDACEKARAILNGAHPLQALRGSKVRSFYRNIAEPLRPGPVTIDRHAVAILFGTDTPTFLRLHPKLLERAHVYRLATAFYRRAAREHGLLPHEVQAIAWLVQSNRSSALPTF